MVDVMGGRFVMDNGGRLVVDNGGRFVVDNGGRFVVDNGFVVLSLLIVTTFKGQGTQAYASNCQDLADSCQTLEIAATTT